MSEAFPLNCLSTEIKIKSEKRIYLINEIFNPPPPISPCPTEISPLTLNCTITRKLFVFFLPGFLINFTNPNHPIPPFSSPNVSVIVFLTDKSNS